MTNDSAAVSLIENALREDAPNGDVTSQYFVPEDATCKAKIYAKGDGIFCGADILIAAGSLFKHSLQIAASVEDRDPIKGGQSVCTLTGSTRDILMIERTVLNIIQRLSGIATITRRYVDALNNSNIAVLDTRKTTPLLRQFERSAVRAGGGVNHRLNLSDMILIKENHLSALKKSGKLATLDTLFATIKSQNPSLKIEVEIETLDDLETIPLHGADIILLDNFSLDEIPKAREICDNKGYQVDLEVSGNITLDTIGKYRDLPIDRISVGRLTHSVSALDLSLIIDD